MRFKNKINLKVYRHMKHLFTNVKRRKDFFFNAYVILTNYFHRKHFFM